MATDVQRKILALTALALNYGKPFPEPLLKLWLDMLDEYSAEQVEQGVQHVMREYEYKTLPPFAILNKAIKALYNIVPEEQLIHMAAEAEWVKLRTLIRENGWVHPPKDLHPTTAYVVNAFGGWSAVCNWYSDEMQWRRKEFIERWEMANNNIALMEGGADAVLDGRRGMSSIGAGISGVFQKLAEQSDSRKALQ